MNQTHRKAQPGGFNLSNNQGHAQQVSNSQSHHRPSASQGSHDSLYKQGEYPISQEFLKASIPAEWPANHGQGQKAAHKASSKSTSTHSNSSAYGSIKKEHSGKSPHVIVKKDQQDPEELRNGKEPVSQSRRAATGMNRDSRSPNQGYGSPMLGRNPFHNGSREPPFHDQANGQESPKHHVKQNPNGDQVDSPFDAGPRLRMGEGHVSESYSTQSSEKIQMKVCFVDQVAVSLK